MRTSIASLADRLLARLVPRTHAEASGTYEQPCAVREVGGVWCQFCQTCCNGCGPCDHKCPGTICWY